MAAHSLSSLPLSPSPSRCLRRQLTHSSPLHNQFNPNSSNLSFTGLNLSSRRPADSRRYIHKHRSYNSETTSLSVLTPELEEISTNFSPRLSARAIKSIALGGLEARKLKHNKVGTESIIMGILVEGTSLTAKLLRDYGFTVAIMQQEIIKLIGKSSYFYTSPLEPPMTQQAKWAFDWAVEEKRKSGDTGEVTTNHLLLGIWSVKESAGHKILAAYGFNDEKAKELAKSVNKEFNLTFKAKRKVIA